MKAKALIFGYIVDLYQESHRHYFENGGDKIYEVFAA